MYPSPSEITSWTSQPSITQISPPLKGGDSLAPKKTSPRTLPEIFLIVTITRARQFIPPSCPAPPKTIKPMIIPRQKAVKTHPYLNPLYSSIINPPTTIQGSSTRWATQRSFTARLGTSAMPLIISVSNFTPMPPTLVAPESLFSMTKVIPKKRQHSWCPSRIQHQLVLHLHQKHHVFYWLFWCHWSHCISLQYRGQPSRGKGRLFLQPLCLSQTWMLYHRLIIVICIIICLCFLILTPLLSLLRIYIYNTSPLLHLSIPPCKPRETLIPPCKLRESTPEYSTSYYHSPLFSVRIEDAVIYYSLISLSAILIPI